MADSNNEQQRLAAVHKYDLLDTPNEECFDRFAALAARVCDAPICLVSIVDEDRVWFKSAHGLPLQEVPREGTLCSRSILSDEVQVVEDTLQDELTANSELVTELGIRFFAAAPLIDEDGFRLGTLCILDTKPRSFSLAERANLEDLSYLVMDKIRLRHARNALRSESDENDKLCEKLADKKRLEGLGVLVGGLAHYLNNLLVPVVVNSELIQSSVAADSELAELASEIELAGNRAAKLCAQLLAFAGQRRSARTRVFVSDVVEHSIKMLKDSIGNAAIDLRFSNHAVPHILEVDVAGLSQVFYNVMRNAWDASRDESPRVDIELFDVTPDRGWTREPNVGRCATDQRYVGVRICDYGEGIDPTVASQMFEPFFTTKTVSETGLGLAAAAGILKSHQGVIFVESLPEEGTSIEIWIPTGEVETRLNHRPTVLVVDHEPVVGNTAGVMLKRIGFRPLIADSTDQALRLLSAAGAAISCAIIDLSLPANGLEALCRYVCQMKPLVPIIVLGGRDANEVLNGSLGLEDCPRIYKPFSFEEFRRLVVQHARQRSIAA